MIIRFVLLSIVVAGFVLLARAILKRTRHLEERQFEDGLLLLENGAVRSALAMCRLRAS